MYCQSAETDMGKRERDETLIQIQTESDAIHYERHDVLKCTLCVCALYVCVCVCVGEVDRCDGQMSGPPGWPGRCCCCAKNSMFWNIRGGLNRVLLREGLHTCITMHKYDVCLCVHSSARLSVFDIVSGGLWKHDLIGLTFILKNTTTN